MDAPTIALSSSHLVYMKLLDIHERDHDHTQHMQRLWLEI